MRIENHLNGILVTNNNRKLLLSTYSVTKENEFLNSKVDIPVMLTPVWAY